MAIANLHETLLSYTMRKNQLNLEITQLQSQKTLVMRAQGDASSLQNARKNELRDQYKALFEEDPELQVKYTDYTEIPEFEKEMEAITAEIQSELDELTNWETELDAQITTNSTELEEITAYTDSLKSMLQSNISEDFNFGLNG